ncbi:hypothetical protein NM208_g17156 [Fusarium decemcellulare]|uniref:Uncharacterized protein n=1 Tax=Fusarium decemcellulare TaxID=57161 RepID=A0ACC1R9D2_9HYPO|nr:hypothetical protein NM208_g17156 [Fusarium decemcellulare]
MKFLCRLWPHLNRHLLSPRDSNKDLKGCFVKGGILQSLLLEVRYLDPYRTNSLLREPNLSTKTRPDSEGYLVRKAQVKALPPVSPGHMPTPEKPPVSDPVVPSVPGGQADDYRKGHPQNRSFFILAAS